LSGFSDFRGLKLFGGEGLLSCNVGFVVFEEIIKLCRLVGGLGILHVEGFVFLMLIVVGIMGL